MIVYNLFFSYFLESLGSELRLRALLRSNSSWESSPLGGCCGFIVVASTEIDGAADYYYPATNPPVLFVWLLWLLMGRPSCSGASFE